MDINQIKLQVAASTGKPFPVLQMVRQFNQQDEPQPWLSHWDNDNRIRVTMHEEIFNQIKADPKLNVLALKKEVVPATAERAEYTRFVVITPRHIEGTF